MNLTDTCLLCLWWWGSGLALCPFEQQSETATAGQSLFGSASSLCPWAEHALSDGGAISTVSHIKIGPGWVSGSSVWRWKSAEPSLLPDPGH